MGTKCIYRPLCCVVGKTEQVNVLVSDEFMLAGISLPLVQISVQFCVHVELLAVEL
jgi:hypothetical protein